MATTSSSVADFVASSPQASTNALKNTFAMKNQIESQNVFVKSAFVRWKDFSGEAGTTRKMCQPPQDPEVFLQRRRSALRRFSQIFEFYWKCSWVCQFPLLNANVRFRF